jgi:hypothetical protein
MRVLDNPIWHSLQTLQAGLGERSARGLARRFQPEVSPFCALSEISPAAWQDMVGLLGGAGVVVCFLESVPETPAGWELLHTEELTQYLADDLQPLGESRGELLGVEDLPEILPLVEETNPGPFGPRTLETGDYIGVRRDGDLVAMAGVRMRMPGFSEVSAVCVHPSARRLGLAGQLTLEVARWPTGSVAPATKPFYTYGKAMTRPMRCIASSASGCGRT